MTTAYVLAAAAETDLREVVRYTATKWGAAQARSYIEKLERGIVRLVTGRGAVRDMSALYPGMRMLHCEHHYIFCLPRDGAPALVVAILHERMDLIVKLAGRLE